MTSDYSARKRAIVTLKLREAEGLLLAVRLTPVSLQRVLSTMRLTVRCRVESSHLLANDNKYLSIVNR